MQIQLGFNREKRVHTFDFNHLLPKAPMNTIDQLLTQIAQQHLGIQTLEAQSADRLDFHEVSVWSLHDALRAAFEAGAKKKSSK